MWPDHCKQGTKGAEYHPNLETNENDIEISIGTDTKQETLSAFSLGKEKTGLNK